MNSILGLNQSCTRARLKTRSRLLLGRRHLQISEIDVEMDVDEVIIESPERESTVIAEDVDRAILELVEETTTEQVESGEFTETLQQQAEEDGLESLRSFSVESAEFSDEISVTSESVTTNEVSCALKSVLLSLLSINISNYVNFYSNIFHRIGILIGKGNARMMTTYLCI